MDIGERRASVSRQIESVRVTKVLLPDGMWHQIVPGSFDADLNTRETIPAAGATWKEQNGTEKWCRVFCPLSSVQAVSYDWE